MALAFDREDSFYTLATPSEGEYKEKGSKFLAFAYPVKTEEDIKNHIEGLKKKFYDARHHCYAYMLGYEKDVFRANDDGEPSSTAGKPILGQILSADISDVLIVVVRYFGGKKLGASGLIYAYKTAAATAIENAKIVPCILQTDIVVDCSFSEVEKVMRMVKNYELAVLNQEYTAEKVIISLRVRNKLLDTVLSGLDFATVKVLD